MVQVSDILLVENGSGFLLLAEVTQSEYDEDKVFLNPSFATIWEARSAASLAERITETAALLLAATIQPPFTGETFALDAADDEGDYTNDIPYYRLTAGALVPWDGDDEGEE